MTNYYTLNLLEDGEEDRLNRSKVYSSAYNLAAVIDYSMIATVAIDRNMTSTIQLLTEAEYNEFIVYVRRYVSPLGDRALAPFRSTIEKRMRIYSGRDNSIRLLERLCSFARLEETAILWISNNGERYISRSL